MGPVLAIGAAVAGVVSATVGIVKMAQSKRQGEAALRVAKVQARQEQTEAIRKGALDRLAQSRRAIVAAQAAQAEALATSIQQRKQMTRLVLGSSFLVLTVIAMKRR